MGAILKVGPNSSSYLLDATAFRNRDDRTSELAQWLRDLDDMVVHPARMYLCISTTARLIRPTAGRVDRCEYLQVVGSLEIELVLRIQRLLYSAREKETSQESARK